ncbi:MAG: SagB/ThcOx family dehydrogenase [Acidobacteriota bacterium]
MATTFLIVAALAFVALETSGTAWSQPLDRLAEKRVLPAPQTSGGPSLASVLATRRSRREFGARALDDAELGQLLWAAQGVSDGHRTAPSAGALYPLTIHVVDARGVWHYVPADHAVVRDATGDHRGQLVSASFGQAATRAPEVLVVTADIAVTAKKYGARAERFATLEAGHVAENVLLEAAALGLDAVPVGAFDEAAVRRALGLTSQDTPLYLIPVGPPP